MPIGYCPSSGGTRPYTRMQYLPHGSAANAAGFGKVGHELGGGACVQHWQPEKDLLQSVPAEQAHAELPPVPQPDVHSQMADPAGNELHVGSWQHVQWSHVPVLQSHEPQSHGVLWPGISPQPEVHSQRSGPLPCEQVGKSWTRPEIGSAAGRREDPVPPRSGL